MASLAAFPLSAVLFFIPGWREYSLVLFLLGWFVPFGAVLGHALLTCELSAEEKGFWLGALGVSWRSVPAVWTYLFAANLKRATGELRRPAKGERSPP